MPTISLGVIGLQLPAGYTDPSGNVYPAAFAFPVQHTEDRLAYAGGVTWYVWKDAESFRAGLQPVLGGQHTVAVNKTAFLSGASLPPQGATQGANSGALDIYLAMNVLDTPDTNQDGSPKLNQDGSQTMRSWFAGATPVSFQLNVNV